MFPGVGWLKRKINKIVAKVWPYGIDRRWREWHKYNWPKIVEAGPPADLTEKESKAGYWELVVDLP